MLKSSHYRHQQRTNRILVFAIGLGALQLRMIICVLATLLGKRAQSCRATAFGLSLLPLSLSGGLQRL